MFFQSINTIFMFVINFINRTFNNVVTKFVKNYKYAITSKYFSNFVKMEQKHRENPIVAKLETPEFKSLFTPEFQDLIKLFDKYNYDIRIAGGAVRDLLMGKKPTDVDFATTATPDQMKKMFEEENIRMINMKGEKHGTITPRINDKENFEVTTLRIDVVTDGRHAEVEFTTDWLLDANRRDLTINSMFLGVDGSVYDYFYGYEDLQDHRVAFVGDADTRIKEDYLRILRYFRFYGRISKNPDKHDENTLRVISQNVQGLERISGERIWSEIKKILSGNFAGELINTMYHVGCLKYCGFSDKPNIDELNRVWSRSKNLKLHPVTLLASLLKTVDEAVTLNERLKMSAFDRDLIFYVIENREILIDPNPLKPYKLLTINNKRKASEAKLFVEELLKYNASSNLEEFQNWEVPRFPVSGNILKENGFQMGKFLGVVLNELKNYWAKNDFKPTVEELIKKLPEIKGELEEKKKNR